MDRLPRIPTPWEQRLSELRVRFLPLVTFCCALVAFVCLWRSFVQPIDVVGEVEAIRAHVTPSEDGTVVKLLVDRFDVVTNDQVVGEFAVSGGEKLRPELKRMLLRAPMAGMVAHVARRSGEKVTRGTPIVTISAPTSDRVVGYLRQPLYTLPTTNDIVRVVTRKQPRQVTTGQILKVGPSIEPKDLPLLSPDTRQREVGLPVLVSLPANMRLIPGEFVDMSLVPHKHRQQAVQ